MPLQATPYLKCFLVILSTSWGNRVMGCQQDGGPFYPSAEIKPSIPGDVMPTGYNVTLSCVGKKAEKVRSGPIVNALVTEIYWWREGQELKKCGSISDRKETRTCDLVIVNGTSAADAGEYRCDVRMLYGCAFTTRNLTWSEPALPKFPVQPRAIYSVTAGNDVTLTCEAIGTPEVTITWYKEGVKLVGANASTVGQRSSLLTFNNVTAQDHGTYWCLASNVVGKERSDPYILQVSYAPRFVVHPKSLDVKPGTNVTLSCIASGYPEPILAWRRNNQTLVNATVVERQNRSLLVLRSVRAARDDGNYSCVASNELGVAVSHVGVIHVTPVEKITFPRSQMTPDPPDPPNPSNPPQTQSNIVIWSVVGALCAVVTATLVVLLLRASITWRKKKSHALQVHFTPAKQPTLEAKAQIQVTGANEQIVDVEDEKFLETLDDWTYLKMMGIGRNWEIPRQRLTISATLLGGGEFGLVKRGSYERRNGRKLTVAVKLLKENADHEAQQALISELRILKHVGRHPNVLSLVGACTFDEPICVVTEFVSGGNLKVLLMKSRVDPLEEERTYTNITSTLTERQLIQIAVDVANGMRHLESKQCLHRDLAARNVLIGDKMVAKVADFGLARDISSNGHYILSSGTKLPFKWMPPEALQGFWTTKSDVWSFGIVLWEIVTLGEEPYEKENGLPQLFKKLTEGYRLERPPHCSEELYSIMLDCWKGTAEDRPTFTEIHETLQQILGTNERIYINVTVQDQARKDPDP